MTERGSLPAFSAALGLVLVVVGVVVFAIAGRSPAEFGWTSYAPLEPGAPGPYRSGLTLSFDDGWAVLWTGGHLLGAALVVLGLLVLAAVGGWLLGRRTASGHAEG
jgi:heme/copper-type cytochrome/quinol oxidase subunit 1